jgi:hypothetical protein
VAEQPDSRSPLAEAIEWVSVITTIGFEFSLPALLGFALDNWWRTTPAATLFGVVLGFAVGMLHTIKIAQLPPGRAPGAARKARGNSQPHDSGRPDEKK